MESELSSALSKVKEGVRVCLQLGCRNRIPMIKYDGHTRCSDCIGQVCNHKVRCVECVSWPDEMMSTYLKHRSVLGKNRVRKSRMKAKAANREVETDVDSVNSHSSGNISAPAVLGLSPLNSIASLSPIQPGQPIPTPKSPSSVSQVQPYVLTNDPAFIALNSNVNQMNQNMNVMNNNFASLSEMLASLIARKDSPNSSVRSVSRSPQVRPSQVPNRESSNSQLSPEHPSCGGRNTGVEPVLLNSQVNPEHPSCGGRTPGVGLREEPCLPDSEVGHERKEPKDKKSKVKSSKVKVVDSVDRERKVDKKVEVSERKVDKNVEVSERKVDKKVEVSERKVNKNVEVSGVKEDKSRKRERQVEQDVEPSAKKERLEV